MQQLSLTPRRSTPRRVVAVVAMITLFGVARPVSAQGPNAEQGAVAEEGADRWAAAAELSMTATSGNQEVTVLATGFTLRHLRRELFDFQLKLQARYGSSRGEQVVENYQGALNLDIGPDHRWSPFFRSTAEHDPFKRLDVRVNSGAGAKYRLYRAEDHGEASMSLGLFHSYEALSTDVPSRTNRARWSLALSGRQEIRDGVTLSSDANYQPLYNDTGDYLLAFDTALKVLVTRSIALSIAHEYNQDTTPAEGVGEIDRLLRAGILIEL